jgi:hypothetical protein
MGQTFGMYDYRVSNPKTPYEYSRSDWFMDEKYMHTIEECIQEQLEADARHVEELLHRYDSVRFYERDILRVKLDPTKFQPTHAVLSRGIRVKYLLKNLKIPYTNNTHREGQGHLTTIQKINIPMNQDKSFVSSSE